MKNKIIIGVLILIIILIGVVYIFFIKDKTNENEILDYIPEGEIEEQTKAMVTLYFKSKDTNELMPEPRLISSKDLLDNPYSTLVNLLLEGPKNERLEKTIPEGTKINKIELKKDVIYLDVSVEFCDNVTGAENEKNAIYGIVNTLTELKEVNGLKILVNGEENKSFTDNMINFKEVFVKLR